MFTLIDTDADAILVAAPPAGDTTGGAGDVKEELLVPAAWRHAKSQETNHQ